MTDPGQRLARHLTLAIVLKLVALALIWQFFVRDQRVAVDDRRAAENVAPSTAQPTSLTPEATHDQ